MLSGGSGGTCGLVESRFRIGRAEQYSPPLPGAHQVVRGLERPGRLVAIPFDEPLNVGHAVLLSLVDGLARLEVRPDETLVSVEFPR